MTPAAGGAKSDERRSAILDRLADYVLAEGLSAASLRPLAQAAGISDRMLLYYFRDKAEVIAAIIERIAARLMVLLNEGTGQSLLPLDRLRDKVLDVVLADRFWPFMRLWLEIASLSARGDPFYRAVGEQMARGFLSWGRAQLDSPTEARRDADAAVLFVTIEGMVLMKSVGMDELCRHAF